MTRVYKALEQFHRFTCCCNTIRIRDETFDAWVLIDADRPLQDFYKAPTVARKLGPKADRK